MVAPKGHPECFNPYGLGSPPPPQQKPVTPHVHRGWLSSQVHAYIFLVTMFMKDGDG
jgi:hypothetical protein